MSGSRGTPLRHQRWIRWILLAGIATLAAGGLAARSGFNGARYTTQEVVHGDITVIVTATGTLQPRNQVDIGSELSGTVRQVNVDVNQRIEAGQILAVLDATRLEAQVLQAESSLATAEARVVQTDAAGKEAHASHGRLLRLRELSGNKLPAQQDMDVAAAKVSRAIGESAAARAAIALARARLDAIRADLGKAAIRSPVTGIVLARSVEPGQTVAASLRAPVLFTLAEDLREMELHVVVDEANVGAVRAGQEATFTVDAFPDRSFDARVTQVHLASNVTQRRQSASGIPGPSPEATSIDVVTFETVLKVDNSELRLRPGMTATAEIVADTITNTTLVPNTALRFIPDEADLPAADDSYRGSGMLRLMPYLEDRWKCPSENGQILGCVWILEKGKPVLAFFRPGARDGSMTQVLTLSALPDRENLPRLKDDQTFAKAAQRKLAPGTRVIISSR